MTEPYEQYNSVFFAGVTRAFGLPGTPPYWDLARAATLGFDPDLATRTLAHHDWLAFLNRLWDCERADGVPIGPVRVPPRIWEHAGQDSPAGRLQARLLEATGLLLPRDFGQELSFHLTLWTAQATEAARSTAALRSTPIARTGGPVSLNVQLVPDGLKAELTAEYPGRYRVQLWWPDGTRASYSTASLSAGQTSSHTIASERRELPSSARIVRRSQS